MFNAGQYELVDFGQGLKLEDFAGIRVLRPCPAANRILPLNQRALRLMNENDRVSYSRTDRRWTNSELVPDNWSVHHPSVGQMSLKLTPQGQVGLFCEQADNWDWIGRLPIDLRDLNALNLFAYTGGTTLALARRGAHVTHVDAAGNVVNWARKNAMASRLETAPVRWIVDDACKYMRREIKRGRRYDIVVADPPAIGHAGKRMTWKFSRDIRQLFDLMGRLLAPSCSAVLITGHTSGFNAEDLFALAHNHLPLSGKGRDEWNALDLRSRDGRSLNCGYFYRWHRVA